MDVPLASVVHGGRACGAADKQTCALVRRAAICSPLRSRPSPAYRRTGQPVAVQNLAPLRPPAFRCTRPPQRHPSVSESSCNTSAASALSSATRTRTRQFGVMLVPFAAGECQPYTENCCGGICYVSQCASTRIMFVPVHNRFSKRPADSDDGDAAYAAVPRAARVAGRHAGVCSDANVCAARVAR